MVEGIKSHNMYTKEIKDNVIRNIRNNPLMMGTNTTELMIQQIEADTKVGQQFIEEWLSIDAE